jgi:hypothetical protein
LGKQERRGREDIKEASWGKEIQEGETVKMVYTIKRTKHKGKHYEVVWWKSSPTHPFEMIVKHFPNPKKAKSFAMKQEKAHRIKKTIIMTK